MIDQIMIAACGIASVWLSQSHVHRTRRWACIIGMCAQPFWLHMTWQAEQWGVFILSLVYAIGWGRGVWNFWIRPKLEGAHA